MLGGAQYNGSLIWQLEWIASHGARLETLILDDSPNSFYIWPFDSLHEHTSKVRHDDHIQLVLGSGKGTQKPPDHHQHDDVEEGQEEKGQDNSHYHYTTRWHDLLPHLQRGLPNLPRFVYRHGDWPRNSFDGRDEIVPALQRSRYVVYNGRIGPTQWQESSREGEGFDTMGFEDVAIRSPAEVEPPFRLPGGREGKGEALGGGEEDQSGGRKESGDWMGAGGGCQEEDREALARLLGFMVGRARARGEV